VGLEERGTGRSAKEAAKKMKSSEVRISPYMEDCCERVRGDVVVSFPCRQCPVRTSPSGYARRDAGGNGDAGGGAGVA